jgi:diacylglycerol kinase family enzyme
MRDGLLDVCVFRRASWWTLLRCGPPLLLWRRVPEAAVMRLRVESFELSASSRTPFEIDGELAGRLPVKIALMRNALRVLVPK